MIFLKNVSLYVLGFVAILICAISSLSIGRYELSFSNIVAELLGYGDEVETNIIFYFHLPRIVLAIAVVAGVAFQSLFRNPLATPDILSVTSGASFGAVLGIAFRLKLELYCHYRLSLWYSLTRISCAYRL